MIMMTYASLDFQHQRKCQDEETRKTDKYRIGNESTYDRVLKTFIKVIGPEYLVTT